MQSDFLRLNVNDWTKGLIVAVLAVVLGTLQQALMAHGLDFMAYDWGSILNIALTSGLAYLSKNLITDSQGKTVGISKK